MLLYRFKVLAINLLLTAVTPISTVQSPVMPIGDTDFPDYHGYLPSGTQRNLVLPTINQ